MVGSVGLPLVSTCSSVPASVFFGNKRHSQFSWVRESANKLGQTCVLTDVFVDCWHDGVFFLSLCTCCHVAKSSRMPDVERWCELIKNKKWLRARSTHLHRKTIAKTRAPIKWEEVLIRQLVYDAFQRECVTAPQSTLLHPTPELWALKCSSFALDWLGPSLL